MAKTAAPRTDLRDDLHRVPFCRHGSWWHLFCPPRPHMQPVGPGLYLRSNRLARLGRRELLKLELLAGDEVVPHRATARPHLLELRPQRGDGLIEFLFVGEAGAHARGRGVGLRLRAPGGFGQVVTATPDGRLVITQHDTQRRCVLAVRGGRFVVDAPWRTEGCEHITIDVRQGGDAAWELTLEEVESTWPAPAAPDFARRVSRCQAEWEAFRAPFGRYPRRWAAAADFAIHILWSFTVPPCGLLRRPTVLMARGWMDAVWSWDNWFNLCALAAPHPRLALDQALLMTDHQDEHGCYPDVVAAPYRFYIFHKPPTQGVLLRWLRTHAPQFLTPAVRRRLYPTLAAFTNWWITARRWPGRRLCHYLHGNDAGWDNATLFDGGVPVESPDLAALITVQADELAALADALGKRRAAAEWRATADAFAAALVEELWDGDGFAAHVLSTGQRCRSRSLIGCLPLVLGPRLAPPQRRALVQRVRGLLTPHGVASEPLDSPAYEDDGYWRGPVWGASTLLIVCGLAACGETALARTIAQRFCDTCALSGFAENYDARTGVGYRDPAYSWTASCFLALLPYAGRS
jgi:putative isomerase